MSLFLPACHRGLGTGGLPVGAREVMVGQHARDVVHSDHCVALPGASWRGSSWLLRALTERQAARLVQLVLQLAIQCLHAPSHSMLRRAPAAGGIARLPSLCQHCCDDRKESDVDVASGALVIAAEKLGSVATAPATSSSTGSVYRFMVSSIRLWRMAAMAVRGWTPAAERWVPKVWRRA